MLSLRAFITNRCNMRCTYCRVRDSGLTVEWARSRKFLRSEAGLISSSVGDIHILGGEPCLEFALVNKLIKGLREDAGFEGRILMFTNGVLINSRRARILNDYNVKVIVSIDSIDDVNDRERRLRCGRGAVYQKAFRAVEMIGADRARVHITVTSKNIKALPGFLSVLSDHGIYDVGIFPADYVLWNDTDITAMRSTMNAVIDSYGDTFSLANYLGIMNVTPPDRFPCNRVYLGPDGNFYICKCFSSLPQRHSVKFIIGSLEEGIDFDARDRILTSLYSRVRTFEKNRFRGQGWRSILPYIYCPINNLIYSDLIKHDSGRSLVSYYKVMRAFNEPIVKYVENRSSAIQFSNEL